MRVYKIQHAFYCGVDLHGRRLFVNVFDDKSTTPRRQPPEPFPGHPPVIPTY